MTNPQGNKKKWWVKGMFLGGLMFLASFSFPLFLSKGLNQSFDSLGQGHPPALVSEGIDFVLYSAAICTAMFFAGPLIFIICLIFRAKHKRAMDPPHS